jgi:hypothetical protein
VTKLNATGSALVYSTYLGGGRSKKSPTYSGGAGVAVDSSGNAYVTGWTNSTTFPTKNALQTTNAGGFDAFVTVLNPSGSGLLFSTYLGDDDGYGIALDSAGNAYVGGGTGSSNFPTTPGVYQTTPGAGFVLKIDPPADVSEVSVPIPTNGTAFNLTVTALDAYGNTATGYTGTVHFTDSVSGATLPHNYTFTATDAGVHTFTGLKLRTKGQQTITVEDTLTGSILGTWTISVV